MPHGRLILLCLLAMTTGLQPESSGAAARVDGPGNLRAAVDLNLDPDILEVEMVAAQRRVDLTGNGLFANAYTINGASPGPELRLKVGDLVIIHFTNELPEPTSIHWHGIEVDNANDGTNRFSITSFVPLVHLRRCLASKLVSSVMPISSGIPYVAAVELKTNFLTPAVSIALRRLWALQKLL